MAGAGRTLGELVALRLARRGVLGGLAGLAAGLGVPGRSSASSTLTFPEVGRVLDETHHVAEGYTAKVLLRWGDPIRPWTPAFDPSLQTALQQEEQVGFNCDFLAFLPLPYGSGTSDRGLLVVNHEYTDPRLMFPGLGREKPKKLDAGLVDIELAAHGLTVVEVVRGPDGWSAVLDGESNRRITGGGTPMAIGGPARGHERMRTAADPAGETVIGTLGNCSGGVTPWGTVLTCEENIDQYFAGQPKGREEGNHRRMGIQGKPHFAWWAPHQPRFDVGMEPSEPNRFGWVVEIDPYDPHAMPIKRTALGRFKHEAATVVLSPDGRAVVYSGDDESMEHLYKFVSAAAFEPGDRARNLTLLEDGTLYAARFAEDGTLTWLPLVHGQGPLTEDNGFASQADVVIEARRAADLMGATKLDRPEDVETDPVTGRVYAMLSGNTKREPGEVDAANPRADNELGHILEIAPPGAPGAGADHAAETATWTVFLLAGNPFDPGHGARYGEGMGGDGWLTNPDNCAFDPQGRLWITTDGEPKHAKAANALYACDTDGPGRAVTRRFLAAPRGAELTGPCFTPDGTTLFVSVQHPGEGGKSTFAKPSTRWPDFSEGMPPRPSVLAITRDGGGPVGG